MEFIHTLNVFARLPSECTETQEKENWSVITAWLILPSSFSGKMVAILTYYSVFPKTYLIEVCWNTKKNMKTNTLFCKNFWNGEIVSRGPDAFHNDEFITHRFATIYAICKLQIVTFYSARYLSCPCKLICCKENAVIPV